MISVLNEALFDKSLKNGGNYATRENEFSQNRYFVTSLFGLRVSSEVSSKSISFRDDCLKTSLNYSIRFPADG